MAHEEIKPFEYVDKLMELTSSPGTLLGVIDADDEANVMTIGWCGIGRLWDKPVCTIYVRPSRHSFTCLEQVRQFTVNAVPASFAKEVLVCGTVSGRDEDKFERTGLTAAPARKVKAPVIEQVILCYECNVLHYNDMIPENIQKDIIGQFYPQGDYHRLYFGEIISCYGDVERLKQV